MKRKIRLIALSLALLILCGCTKIPDLGASNALTDSGSESSVPSTPQGSDTGTVSGFTVSSETYLKKLEAEKGATSGAVMDFPADFNSIGESDSSAPEADDPVESEPRQFVRLADKQYLTLVVNMPSSQFYRIIIGARSEKGAAIKFQLGDSVEGAYFVRANDKGSDKINCYAVDNLYMPVGLNTLKFTMESGTADIDYIIAENSLTVSPEIYNTGNACVSPGTTEKTAMLMKTLAFNYSKLTFSAQNVSCGTNAEIDAIYAETKRYPAIRVSELAPVLKDDDKSPDLIKADLDLAINWRKEDGICAYAFHWYSPNFLRSTEIGAFDLRPIFANVDPAELAKLDDDAIKQQVEGKILSEEGATLLSDLDKLAETLRVLEKADVPVLFSPIPNADAGVFWWGLDAASYQKLWELMFRRLCEYHGLKNLIWVWSNSSFSYYPGDRFVDIIGQSFYENSNSSFAGRFTAIGSDPASGRKMMAITACDVLPDINFMFRDNAIWLWTAPDSGEYIINASGKLSEKYTKRASLIFTYNNDKCVTRDELGKLWMNV